MRKSADLKKYFYYVKPQRNVNSATFNFVILKK